MIALLLLLFGQSSAIPTTVTPADEARVASRARPVLHRYYQAVKNCGARPPFEPTIKVAPADGIIHYDQPTGAVVLYAWSAVGGEVRSMALARAAQLGVDGRESYERIFNELLVAHELGHWLQGFQPERRTASGKYDNWFAEQNANRLMVAFWREHPMDSEPGAERLEGSLGEVTANPVPPPAGVSAESFFTDNTMQIVRGGAYGWYQALMTRRAMAERPRPSFCALVAEWLPLHD